MARHLRSSILLGVLALATAGVATGPPAAAGAGSGSPGATTATTVAPPVAGDTVTTAGVTRTVLAVARPDNAAGEVLVLLRVEIAPRTAFAAHFHDGTQVLHLESGRLDLRVTSGTVPVTRADGTTETVTGPARVRLRAGDSWIETEGVAHSGRNPGTTPAVSVAADLVAAGAGLSTPVDDDRPGTPIELRTDFAVTENRLTTLSTPGGTRLFGTAVESADATVAGGPFAGDAVSLRLAENVDYTDGAGPWNGFLTYAFADGSTLATVVTGATVATADGGARFAGTMQVVGGTGRFAGATGGTGTYTGGRTGALGATPLPTEVSVRVTGL